MAKIPLMEGVKGAMPFFPDTSKVVSEALGGAGKTVFRVPGIFSVCEKVNGNNRRYKKCVWEKNLTPGSTLMSLIERNAAFGLLEHPENGQVTLRDPIAISVTAAKLCEGKDKDGNPINEVRGELSIIGTPEGKKLLALIEAGYNPLVSSRGFGSLEKAADGVDDVQDDYICEGWDVVAKPSFEEATLTVPRGESTAAKTESKCPACGNQKTYFIESIKTWSCPGCNNSWNEKGNTTLESKPRSQPISESAAPIISKPQAQNVSKAMNLNEIKSQIVSFRTLNPAKMSQQTYTESMASLQGLHQEVDNFLAEDVKRNYQATKLHEEIEGISKTWADAKDEPGKRAVKLTEDNTKLLKVIKAVAQTGINLKTKLGEALKQQSRQTRLLDAVTSRGESWQQLAEKRAQKIAKLEGFYGLACESLDLMAEKYKADLTAVGRRLLEVEFKDKCEQPEIKRLLEQATKPKHLVMIREKIEGKPVAAKLDENGKPITEAAKPNGKPATGTDGKPAPINENITRPAPDPQPTFARLTPDEGDPRSIDESVAMVQRWSAARQTTLVVE